VIPRAFNKIPLQNAAKSGKIRNPRATTKTMNDRGAASDAAVPASSPHWNTAVLNNAETDEATTAWRWQSNGTNSQRDGEA